LTSIVKFSEMIKDLHCGHWSVAVTVFGPKVRIPANAVQVCLILSSNLRNLKIPAYFEN
jgi:hypothetical protein